MHSRITRTAVAISSAAVLVGCAMRNAAASGISAEEMHVLVGNYYWKRDLSAPSYTSAQPDMLLRASANPTLDGERAEAQTSRLAVALACVGDEKFAEALSRQSGRVKHMVAFFISTLWDSL